MWKQALLLKCGALLVFCSALLVSGVGTASAQSSNASKLKTDVNIDIRDYCDPASFNAAVGPGTCDRSVLDGFITFDGFVAELLADQSVGAWRFAPSQTSVAEKATLHITNLGGETHTFTQVKDFGGGFVGFLNGSSGNPVPAPECAHIVDGKLVPQPPSADNIFLGPGQTATVTPRSRTEREVPVLHPSLDAVDHHSARYPPHTSTLSASMAAPGWMRPCSMNVLPGQSHDYRVYRGC